MAAPIDESAPIEVQKLKDGLAKYNDKFRSNITDLKTLQKEAIEILMSGKDCVCSLPTGYGKTLIYELLPFVDPGCLVVVKFGNQTTKTCVK